MASASHFVDLTEDDDDEVRPPMDSDAAGRIRLDLRDDSDIVTTGESSSSSGFVERIR